MSGTILAVFANESSFVTIHARDVFDMAQRTLLQIEADRALQVRDAVRDAMENEEILYFLGIPIFRRKAYKNADEAMQSPQVQTVMTSNWRRKTVAQGLKNMASYLLENESIPEDKKVINVSISDFKLICGE